MTDEMERISQIIVALEGKQRSSVDEENLRMYVNWLKLLDKRLKKGKKNV